MTERLHLDWFRERLAVSRSREPKVPTPILAWQESERSSVRFKANLIGIDEGSRLVTRRARQSCGTKAVSFLASRSKGREWRLARSGLVGPADLHSAGWRRSRHSCSGNRSGRRSILAASTPECGNIGVIQLGPTIQSTWSNIRRAHGWASLSQIKELALLDNVLNPFVKTILMPL
jgi:dTDP-4-dehydro-6-deoxy-alpha-D-glucopyranose 2,3-dehydratase